MRPPLRCRPQRPVITALAGGVGAARLLRGMVEVVPPDDLDGGGQRGRRHRPPRSAHLPRSGHGDVHPGRRHQPRDRLGPQAARRGGSWSPSAGSVASRGSISGTRTSPPTVPDPAPLRGRTARHGHRRAGRTLRGRHSPPAGHRRSAAHQAATGRRGRGRLPGVLREAPPRGGGRRGPVRRAPPPPGRDRASSRRSPGPSTVVVCPSNPVVSIDPLLAVPGVADALAARRDDIIAVSPIVAGAALKGPADRLLVEMGFESSVVGVARWYASWVSTLVIDEADAGTCRGRRGGGRPLHGGSDHHVRCGPCRRPWPRSCSRCRLT